MTNFREKIQALTATFAGEVLKAILNSSADLLDQRAVRAVKGEYGGTSSATSVAKRGRPRKARLNGSSAVAPERLAQALAQHPKGLRSEELRSALGVDRGALQTALRDALLRKVVTKSGKLRGTIYQLASAAPHVPHDTPSSRPSPEAPTKTAKPGQQGNGREKNRGRKSNKSRREAYVVLGEGFGAAAPKGEASATKGTGGESGARER